MPSKQELLDGLLDTMTDMSSLNPLARVLLHGEPGHGKTVLGMQLAHALLTEPQDHILYVDTAQGFTTLAINNRWNYLTQHTVRMKYQGRSQLIAVADNILEQNEHFKKFKVIVLDETTTIADRGLAAVGKSRVADKTRSDPFEITWPDRNIFYNMFRDMLANLYNCDVHIIHLCHTIADDKETVGRVILRPSFGPGLVNSVLAPLQLVGFVRGDTDKDGKYQYRVQVRPTKEVQAKNQFDIADVKVPFETVIDAVSRFTQIKQSDPSDFAIKVD